MVSALLGGDVMLGRGVDQILPHPGNPALREAYVRDARGYVEFAEQVNGPIPRPVDFSYPWGDALAMLDDLAPDVRVLNLETAVTADGDFAERKAIHYRMNPANVGALTSIRPGVCTLANNHVLDFGPRGLADTVEALGATSISGIGAGADLEWAQRPAVLDRVIVGSIAMCSSGVPRSWAARHDRPGVWLITDPSSHGAADDVAARVLTQRRTGDVAIVSVHWGSNWGYDVEQAKIQFAHRLVDAGVDIVHGHSSHHPRPIEVYRGKPILYGCGDVIDDYEGISGHESYRNDLKLLYLVSIEADGELAEITMIPLRVRRMRLERASRVDTEWLRATMEYISRRFDITVVARPDGLLAARWQP